MVFGRIAIHVALGYRRHHYFHGVSFIQCVYCMRLSGKVIENQTIGSVAYMTHRRLHFSGEITYIKKTTKKQKNKSLCAFTN